MSNLAAQHDLRRRRFRQPRGGPRKRVMSAFKLEEISVVDKPAQEGALAAITKRFKKSYPGVPNMRTTTAGRAVTRFGRGHVTTEDDEQGILHLRGVERDRFGRRKLPRKNLAADDFELDDDDYEEEVEIEMSADDDEDEEVIQARRKARRRKAGYGAGDGDLLLARRRRKAEDEYDDDLELADDLDDDEYDIPLNAVEGFEDEREVIGGKGDLDDLDDEDVAELDEILEARARRKARRRKSMRKRGGRFVLSELVSKGYVGAAPLSGFAKGRSRSIASHVDEMVDLLVRKSGGKTCSRTVALRVLREVKPHLFD